MTSSGAPGTVGETTFVVEILDAFPAKALNEPGAPAEIVVELHTTVPLDARLMAELQDRGDVIVTAERTVAAVRGTSRVVLTLNVPGDDARGYSVLVRVFWQGGETTASTALLAASHWRLLPRYGFLSDFNPMEKSGATDSEHVDLLARFHVTAVQFYDWMYRHYRFLPPADAIDGADETFTDAMGRVVSLAAVRKRIAECQRSGMATIAYGAVYGPEPEFILDRPDWLLYDAAGEPLHLIERFYITDLRPGGWREHILGEFESAIRDMGFDGIHMDQYGFPKLAYDSDGELVDVGAQFGPLIDEAATRVAAVRDGAAVIFNAVNAWPLTAVAGSDQAAVYIEVWSPHDTYRDLVALVRSARAASGKQAILAAYLRAFHEPGSAAEWSLRFATAVINAAGGHHLLLGEGDAVLREPYYPDHGRLTHDGLSVARRYYDHTAANAHYLHAGDLQPVENYYATGINTALNLVGAPASVSPEAGKVWIAIAQRPGQYVVNLVNLTGMDDEQWDVARSEPPALEGLRLECEPFIRIQRVTYASPDVIGDNGSPLEVRVDTSGRVSVPLPQLWLWQTIVIDHV